jgi:hypothetical protein
MAQTTLSGPVYVVGNELVDAKYGPYLNTTQVLTLLPINDRKIGQTVGVYDGTGVAEYWFKDGIEDADLVAKSSGSGGDTGFEMNFLLMGA